MVIGVQIIIIIHMYSIYQCSLYKDNNSNSKYLVWSFTTSVPPWSFDQITMTGLSKSGSHISKLPSSPLEH